MKTIMSFTIIAIIVGCAGTIPLTDEDKSYQTVIELEGEKDGLYIKSLDWATSKFTGSHEVATKRNLLDEGSILETGIKQSDKESGLIISNGFISILSFPVLQIKYMCRIDLKDNKARITFSNYQYFFDGGPNIRQWMDVNQKSMVDKLKPELEKIVQDYTSKMESGKLEKDW